MSDFDYCATMQQYRQWTEAMLIEVGREGRLNGYHPLKELLLEIEAWLAAYPGSIEAMTADQRRAWDTLAWRVMDAENARTDAALATRYDWYPQEAANE